MGEQVVLPMGEDCLMHNADTKCRVRGEKRPKGTEDFFVYIYIF